MDVPIILKGLIIGFAMAVPIGPLGALCIRKTLTQGRVRGRLIGLAAASIDALYSGIAAFGLTIISDVIERHQFWVRLFGAVVLLLLGVRTLWGKTPVRPVRVELKGLWGTFASTVLIALSNPFPIFAFIAVFAAFGLAPTGGILEASLLVSGVFIGSGLWFLFLSSVSTRFHGRVDAGNMRWIDRAAGVMIIVSGIVLFVGVM